MDKVTRIKGMLTNSKYFHKPYKETVDQPLLLMQYSE